MASSYECTCDLDGFSDNVTYGSFCSAIPPTKAYSVAVDGYPLVNGQHNGPAMW